MSTIKYTSDGKKVVIVGKLNAQQTIVQEVFIVNDAEVPSGENFVVTSLHDAPAISWKEKELAKIEDRYAKEVQEYNRATEELRRRLRNETNAMREKINYAAKVFKNVSPDSFSLLVSYLCGDITHVVVNNYDPELLEWKDFITMYEDKLRLISLFGRDDGTLQYAVGDYSDFSGSTKRFIPFTSYEEALGKFKEVVISKGVSEKSLKLAQKYGFEFPKDKVDTWKANQIEAWNKNIDNYQKSIESWQKSINELTVS